MTDKEKKAMFLPQHLLIQILIRLPTKSLIRFRCVSKSWLSLISDSQFAKLHFELTAIHKETLLIFVPDASEIRFIDINAPSLQASSASVTVKLDFLPSQPSWYSDRILGSCRGFILLDCYPKLCLFNPITGFHREIPMSTAYSYSDKATFFPFLVVHGFGYDPSTEDYLVTAMSYDPTRFSYFSFKANTWKELESPLLPYIEPEEFGEPRLGLLFNGAIHWFACCHDQSVEVIAVFDLVERSFSEIDLPHDFDGNLDFCKLRVFGEFLSLCTAGRIWVMEEYKVQSSWTKRDIEVSQDQLSAGLYPICCTSSGDIVGINACDKLVKLNDTGEVQDYCDLPKGYYGEDIYTESLFSLLGDS